MITQTPWIERKFEFNFPVGTFPIIIERLRETGPGLEIMLKKINDEKLCHKEDTQWSIKEQVGHLCDAEEIWYVRIEDFLSGKQILQALTIVKTEQTNHNMKSIGELLEQFSAERNKLVAKVKDMDETTASLSLLHPRLNKQMRLIDSLFVTVEHDDHHLAKIRELLE